MTDKEYAEFLLEQIKLLSALESWAFAVNQHLPDYLHEQLGNVIDRLEKELLK